MTHVFLRAYWIGATLTISMLVAALHILTVWQLSAVPPKPSFPIPGETYVSAYTQGHADHYLFRSGIFGFGERIRESDILILGSSHPQIGLSAAQLSAELSLQAGLTVRAFNLGLGFGEGLAFARDILDQNRISHKTLIVDLFTAVGADVSQFGLLVRKKGTVGSYLGVAEIWTDFARDWLLDGMLPCVRIEQRRPKLRRYLADVIVRRWDTGDMELIWSAEQGPQFPEPPFSFAYGLLQGEVVGGSPEVGVFLSHDDANFFADRDFTALLTLLPYHGYDFAAAEQAAARENLPLLGIATDGLTFFDTHHLTGNGRRLATSRLLKLLLACSPQSTKAFSTSERGTCWRGVDTKSRSRKTAKDLNSTNTRLGGQWKFSSLVRTEID